MFRNWELLLDAAAAPPLKSCHLVFDLKKNRGKSWIEPAKWSAPLQLRSFFKKFAIAPYTCSGFLIVCDFRYSVSGQDVDPARYFSPYFYWRPSFKLLGLFPQVHTKWEFVFTQFSRHLTFQEFSVPPSVYSVFNFDRFALF